MSTIRSNGRISSALIAFLLPVALAETGAIATSSEFDAATRQIATALPHQDDLAAGYRALITPKKPLRWSSDREDKRLLASIRLQYKGVENSHCRLITLPSDMTSAELVAVPIEADFEDCAAIIAVFLFDINEDGALDVVQELRVKSNRYDIHIDVPIVYLSNSAAKGGYCYSNSLSSNLEPLNLQTATSAKDAIAAIKQRLGDQALECFK